MASMNQMIAKHMETSKKILWVSVITWVVNLAATLALLVLFPQNSNALITVFQCSSTLTGSVIIGYMGKAGFENYNKYKTPMNPKDDSENNG